MSGFAHEILVCGGAGCLSSGCKEIRDKIESELLESGIEDQVKLTVTGCMGPCGLGPSVMVQPGGFFYQKVRPEDAAEIVRSHIIDGKPVERLMNTDPVTGTLLPTVSDIPFFSRQKRIVLRNCGTIDPLRIEDYLERDGYKALLKCISGMDREQIIKDMKSSGLRGRGGAGFLTGQKWEFTYKAPGTEKYVVCNADEGDPGAFMDRSVLEGDPHSVIEGMAIAAYAVGASHGYVYVRAEYPLAIANLGNALEQAKAHGWLGKDIKGSGFDFDLEIRVGAGAFVCGEETALLASVEGKRGEPRPRPPFPAQEGLWGKPTVLNNVETYANVAPIILNGWEWFASIGTEKSKGTKVFALAGKIRNTGLVEIPMGTPLGDIIYDIGGGIPGGKKFKAAQTGGPSGGCIPVQHLNTPVDYETLKELGTIMGSGGLIVMDEDTCMVDLAKFFLTFIQDESCGKCSPCRIGTKRMLEIVDRITKGKGKEGDVELLLELGNIIKSTSLCGLGQTAPNPVESTIRNFRAEYDAHIGQGRCEASVCASLFEAPCKNSCPADVDVPRYVALIKQGRFDEAVALIRRTNPFPAICGRVCDHPCESHCRRRDTDEAIAIKSLKRFAADYEGAVPLEMDKLPSTGKKVAVVGAGPSGLTAAYYLAKAGHAVTVFEALPVAGGMMAVGIPTYRLPKGILQREIDNIKSLGVDIRLGVRIGKDIPLKDLMEGYDAVYAAVGAHVEQKLGVPGEDLPGVIPATGFLKEVALGGKPDIGAEVAVIGGGNSAIDAARTALRLGADRVHIIYRRLQEDMPADKAEVKAAMDEGVRFHFLTAPSSIEKEGSKLVLKCDAMRLGPFDRTGRRRPEKDGGLAYFTLDSVISAVGQSPDATFASGFEGLATTKSGIIVADPQTGETSVQRLYSGGDCATGPWTVVAAVGAGRKAAIAIDKAIGGEWHKAADVPVERKLVGEVIEDPTPRVSMPELSPKDRVRSFSEVELGFCREAAMLEASRCFQCDVKD
ncbi:MAG TPA: NADH-quinone oxidoreductase subunit NuoF [Bacillota bacterium]|nr:NADH-quinone oxidoreductase subunit NuoF [Bacillota bacterium]HOG52369.1 NADH-quinone oxidoreductase subunit NuoF [Bacillota bacterium]